MAQHSDNALKNLIQVGIFAPAAIAKARLEICRSCELYNSTTGICTDCHCIMMAKSKIARSSCPQNKWVAYKLPSKSDIVAAKKNSL